MAPEHKDRLTAVDASFLVQEGRSSHMHVGSVLLFEGPPPAYEEVLEGIESRLHMVPRYRQKLAFPRFQTGRPVWVDDPTFNLEYHIRHTALPSPGSLDQLRLLAGRIYSQRLDRSKPLWETWLVQGLEDGRFALITKTHHSMIDGISGVDLASVLFDVSPVPTEVDPEPWTPKPVPSDAELIADGVKDFVKAPLGAAARALGAVQSPGRALRGVRDAAEALGEVAWANLNAAPETPLNVPIGPHRRIRWVGASLADFKHVKNTLGGTVNDVVLTVVAGALRRWLHSRGVRTEGLELRALVPVSIRAEDEHDQLGNRIAAMRGPLPVYVEDPVERLRIVSEAMNGLKDSKQALGAEVISGLSGFAPPTILAQASRLNFSTRIFNLIVTNVPGPQFPLYMHGREALEVIPLAFLPEDHALAIAIMSYNGGVQFGLVADYDAMPDLDYFADAIEESLAELLAAAGDRPVPSGQSPAPAATGGS
ncbi:MAG: diacylglycerol O-acyltransferase / wax synthase [Thermoleophilaceae bacterium]|jgi:diacylglycerol O-acyltransferase|nr:diacylglycerol O-acyltransferase / wax synthase [Thermoleophilaceae bacterium]